MTDYKATPEQWADAGAFASGTRACIFELRARVEALETMREAEKAAVLDLYQQHDKLKEWVGKNYVRIRALEDGATCPHIVTGDDGTSYCALAEQISALEQTQPTPNDRQIRSSLVSQVAIAISRCEDSAAWDDEALNWAPEARAAILEVARWLRSSTDISHGPRVAGWLEQEAER